MWELDYKESWALKNWCFWTVVFEKTLGSPLDSKEMKAINPKGNQHWIFIGKTDVEAETPILWSPDAKNWLIGTDPDAWKDWRQEEKGMTEDEMVGWHHRLDVHGFEQALGIGDGQGSLASCSPWAHKGSDTTEWLNITTGFSQCLIRRVWELWPLPYGILFFFFFFAPRYAARTLDSKIFNPDTPFSTSHISKRGGQLIRTLYVLPLGGGGGEGSVPWIIPLFSWNSNWWYVLRSLLKALVKTGTLDCCIQQA